MWGRGDPAALGALTLSYGCAMVLAALVVTAVIAFVVPALERRWRPDLVPWVVFGSFFVALTVGVLLMPHLIHDRIMGK